MPKNNKKGKKPMRPQRGPHGQWIPASPDPDPPDDQELALAILAAAQDEIPVTAGGLVIREPEPRPRAPVSPQPVASPTRLVIDNGEDTAPDPRSPSGLGATARSSSPKPAPASGRKPFVTIESVTDEDAPHWTAPSSGHRESRPSPESEQQDSSQTAWDPAAQSTPYRAPPRHTRPVPMKTPTPPVSTTRRSPHAESLRQEMRERAERAEARANAAYEQNRAALELISESMNNVKSAYTEARHARDRFHDLLSVSSRARHNVRQHQERRSSSDQRAERNARDKVRGTADYRRRLDSQVLGSEERREVQPSIVSSWRLRSGMYPASLSRVGEGDDTAMDIDTEVSTAQFTPQDAPRNMGAHRMGVRDWVADQRKNRAQEPVPEEQDLPRTRARSPPVRTADASAHRHPASTFTTAPPRATGERVSWFDRLNRPSTSRPYERDPPPHQQPRANPRMATGAPGGHPSGSSSSSYSSSVSTIRNPPPPRPPRTPRRQERQHSSSREGSRVPEYLRTNRAPTFEPVTPGGHRTPAGASVRGAAAAMAPPPVPRFNTPTRPRQRAGPIDPHDGGVNRPARRGITDKIVNMLSVTFITQEQAAERADTIPAHKLGIKSPLPKPYEGEQDQTLFENWLSLLLGYFRIHHLDVLNESQDRTRVEILGQALKDKAHTYYRERHQKFLEQGETWDFREAILDLRDRYLYKSTPFIAARKFETVTQGNRDSQALYDDLTTHAARMIEFPSDYQFRLRFMLALRPEVLEYIIKSHSVSAEQSTLAQIRSACEDYERSHEYGKQLAASQTRFGGPRTSSAQQSGARGVSRAHRPSPRPQVGPQGTSHSSAPARPHEEGQSKAAPFRPTSKPDLRPKPALKHSKKPGTNNVSCFICGGPHYAKECPPENRKAARGYAVRIAEEGAQDRANDADSEYHSAGSALEGENVQPPEPDNQDPDGDYDDSRPEGEQYDPDDVNEYPFSSGEDSEPVHSRATRIIATSALNTIESRAAKASKPTPPKTPIIVNNRARYKIGSGPQPQRDDRLQRCIEVTVPINGLPARVLLDGGSNTNMLSPEFATVAKVTAIELQEQMTLQLAVTGSRSKINYGTWVPIEFGPIRANTYFDIANIDGYDAIVGTPFLWEHGVSPIYDDNGWVMRNGKHIHFPTYPTPVAKSGQSFWN